MWEIGVNRVCQSALTKETDWKTDIQVRLCKMACSGLLKVCRRAVEDCRKAAHRLQLIRVIRGGRPRAHSAKEDKRSEMGDWIVCAERPETKPKVMVRSGAPLKRQKGVFLWFPFYPFMLWACWRLSVTPRAIPGGLILLKQVKRFLWHERKKKMMTFLAT